MLYNLHAFLPLGFSFFQAVDCINEDELFENDDQKIVKSLRVSCWLNGAAAFLKRNYFQEAIKQCSKVMYICNKINQLNNTIIELGWIGMCSNKIMIMHTLPKLGWTRNAFSFGWIIV